MGMYNAIKGKHKLPCCGKEVDDWQSKEIWIKSKSGKLYPIYNCLEEIMLEEIDKGEIHQYCKDDQKFLEYEVKDGKLGKAIKI